VRLPATVVSVAIAGVLGIGVGVLGAFVHSISVSALGVDLPVGLVPALAGLGALLVASGAALRSRVPVIGASIGWAVGVFAMAVPSNEGDLVVAGTMGGYLFLIGGALLIGGCLTLAYDQPATRGPRVGGPAEL